MKNKIVTCLLVLFVFVLFVSCTETNTGTPIQDVAREITYKIINVEGMNCVVMGKGVGKSTFGDSNTLGITCNWDEWNK